MALEAGKYLYFLLIIVPVIAIVMGLITFFTSSLSGTYYPPGIQDKVYETQLLYSPSCFAYQDKITGRVYTGEIDPKKFDEQILRKCVPLQSKNDQAMMVELTLADGTNKPITTENCGIKDQKDISTNSYTVNVKDAGPALITFHHIK